MHWLSLPASCSRHIWVVCLPYFHSLNCYPVHRNYSDNNNLTLFESVTVVGTLLELFLLVLTGTILQVRKQPQSLNTKPRY